MSRIADHRSMIAAVATALGDELLQQVAFVGGCTTGLLLTDEFSKEQVRHTDDVDLIVHVAGYAGISKLQQMLRQRGFSHAQGEEDPICAMQLGDLREVRSRAAALARLGSDDAVMVMRDAHRAIRIDYPAETASYLALLLDADRREAWALCCGDCQLGQGVKADFRWLTPVHDLGGMKAYFTGANLDGVIGRTLTRCLRGRRFEPPEVVHIERMEGPWILATDGYWLEHLAATMPVDGSNDDASCLRLGSETLASRCDSDCENLQVFDRRVLEDRR